MRKTRTTTTKNVMRSAAARPATPFPADASCLPNELIVALRPLPARIRDRIIKALLITGPLRAATSAEAIKNEASGGIVADLASLQRARPIVFAWFETDIRRQAAILEARS